MIKLFILFILISTPSLAMDGMRCEKLHKVIIRCENSEVVCYAYNQVKNLTVGVAGGISCKFKEVE